MTCPLTFTHRSLQTVPLPNSVRVALLGLNTFQDCVRTLALARQHLAEILSAVEFVDAATMEIAVHKLFGGKFPLEKPCHFYVVIETGGSDEAHDEEKLTRFLDKAMAAADGDRPVVETGVVAGDSRQSAALWRHREEASVAVSMRGHTFKYDVSFPIPRMYDLVEEVRQRIEVEKRWRDRHDVRVVGYGHLGDGNLHLNVSVPQRNAPFLSELAHDLDPYVLEAVLARGGSISAEHGLGQAKAGWLERAKPATSVAYMKALKSVFDPAGILNPAKCVVPGAHPCHDAITSHLN